MGGPMPYSRLINRNGLQGWGYRSKPGDPVSARERHLYGEPYNPNAYISREYLEGELRRMEEDTLDVGRIKRYAQKVGITEYQASFLMRTVLGIPEPGCQDCSTYYKWEHGALVQLGRCQKHVVW